MITSSGVPNRHFFNPYLTPDGRIKVEPPEEEPEDDE